MGNQEVHNLLENNLFDPLKDIEEREFRSRAEIEFAENLSRTMVCYYKQKSPPEPLF